jgi:4'-phosphopantetheinyl transferase
MPIIIDKHIGKHSHLALWHITESPEELALLLNCPVDPALLMVNEPLKKQRLCSRLLINRLCAQTCTEIQYDEYGKPFLPNSLSRISISHTHQQVAVILNNRNDTGIDMELIKPQVERISTRFLHEKELYSLDKLRRLEQLTTFWCAKETLYKYFGKKELSFKHELFIEPFPQLEEGTFIGHIQSKRMEIALSLGYEKRGDYMLVYVND